MDKTKKTKNPSFFIYSKKCSVWVTLLALVFITNLFLWTNGKFGWISFGLLLVLGGFVILSPTMLRKAVFAKDGVLITKFGKTIETWKYGEAEIGLFTKLEMASNYVYVYVLKNPENAERYTESQYSAINFNLKKYRKCNGEYVFTYLSRNLAYGLFDVYKGPVMGLIDLPTKEKELYEALRKD